MKKFIQKYGYIIIIGGIIGGLLCKVLVLMIQMYLNSPYPAITPRQETEWLTHVFFTGGVISVYQFMKRIGLNQPIPNMLCFLGSIFSTSMMLITLYYDRNTFCAYIVSILAAGIVGHLRYKKQQKIVSVM